MTSSFECPASAKADYHPKQRAFQLLTVTLLMTLVCGAQEQAKKVNLSVFHSGEDQTGIDFVFALKEEIRKSSGYQLVDETPRDALARPYSYGMISVHSLDENISGKSNSSAFSMVVTTVSNSGGCPHIEIIEQTVFFAGRARVQEVARSMLARIDLDMDEARARNSR